jgi:hypothetical protein
MSLRTPRLRTREWYEAAIEQAKQRIRLAGEKRQQDLAEAREWAREICGFVQREHRGPAQRDAEDCGNESHLSKAADGKTLGSASA